MQIQSATFQTSAARPDQFVKRPIPHVVFAGKSNVGKSSLLNKLLNRKGLAKTSQTPGKTRLINYFLINDRFYFVDIPGYGYAKVSKQEKKGWQELIESYLQGTPQIGLIFLLIDIRHDPGEHDQDMITYLKHFALPFRILLTKADKLSKNKSISQRASQARFLGVPVTELTASSVATGVGVKEIWSYINKAHEETSKALNR